VEFSGGGRYLAVLWGDGPQHLSLYRRNEGELVEVDRFSSDEPILWEGLLRYSADEQLLFYESPGGLAVVDIAAGRRDFIELRGRVFDVRSAGRGEPVYVTGNRNGRGYVHMYTPRAELITAERIAEPITHIYALSGGILCTAGDRAVLLRGGRL
jgi:hypothetical protein